MGVALLGLTALSCAAETTEDSDVPYRGAPILLDSCREDPSIARQVISPDAVAATGVAPDPSPTVGRTQLYYVRDDANGVYFTIEGKVFRQGVGALPRLVVDTAGSFAVVVGPYVLSFQSDLLAAVAPLTDPQRTIIVSPGDGWSWQAPDDLYLASSMGTTRVDMNTGLPIWVNPAFACAWNIVFDEEGYLVCSTNADGNLAPVGRATGEVTFEGSPAQRFQLGGAQGPWRLLATGNVDPSLEALEWWNAESDERIRVMDGPAGGCTPGINCQRFVWLVGNDIVLIRDARLHVLRPNGDCVYRALPSSNVERLSTDHEGPYWAEEYNAIWTLAR